MRADEVITTLEQLGSGQWGLATTAQAAKLGVSRVELTRLLQAGTIHRVRQGVYALPSAGYGPLQELHAAWLSTNPSLAIEDRLELDGDAVVSHLSAARVHGLGDVIPTKHEFTLDRRRQTSQHDLRFHRGEVSPTDAVVVDGLPVTSRERTVVDLAVGRVDLDHLAVIVRDALADPEVRVERLAGRLERPASRFGFATGDELVRACLDRAGMPAVVRNISEWAGKTFPTPSIELGSYVSVIEHINSLLETIRPAMALAESSQKIRDGILSPHMMEQFDRISKITVPGITLPIYAPPIKWPEHGERG